MSARKNNRPTDKPNLPHPSTQFAEKLQNYHNVYGIGVDAVYIDRIRKVYARQGDKFPNYILSTNELKRFKEKVAENRDPVNILAKHWATKEACAKAFGTGFIDGLAFRDIELDHDELGKPILHFHGKAKEMAEAKNIIEGMVSLTDETDLVVGFVALIQGNGR